MVSHMKELHLLWDWSHRQDSNLLPLAYEASALPVMLRWLVLEVGIEPTARRASTDCSTNELFKLVGNAGLEPTTSAMSTQRSSQLS